jgi:predicted aspartyl protease
MSFTYGNFLVKNYDDVSSARNGRIKESEVRQMNIKFLLDTGAWSTYITEEIQETLQLPERASTLVRLGGGKLVLCKVLGPVDIIWRKDSYFFTGNIYIMPGQDKPILGALAMEAMDLWVHPKSGQVERAHTDEEINIMY